MPNRPESEQKSTLLFGTETEWMADTFICRDCQAGWIEPDDPAAITWVRPYWIVDQTDR